MNWLIELWAEQSVAHDVLVLSLVSLCGLAIGNLKVRGVGLGIAGVLFAGIAFAHFGTEINEETLHFLREFGLILFVYGIGLQVGPSFWSSLRTQGLGLNALAAFIVLSGGAITVLVALWAKIPMSAAAGLFAGATTNTPSLAAVQSALSSLPNVSAEATHLPGLGYAIAYPFGVLGIILTMLITRFVFRVNVAEEVRVLDVAQKSEPLEARSLRVENANLDGLKLGDVPLVGDASGGAPVVVSRIMHDDRVRVASLSSTLHQGDVLVGVGTPHDLDDLQKVVGASTEIDVREVPSDVVTRRILVTRPAATSKMLRDLKMWRDPQLAFTRVRRLELEFAATPNFRLQFGDSILAVGEPEAVERAANFFGDDPKRLDAPQLLPVFFGLALGVLLGSVAWPIPGVPNGVKLGLAGGPLLVALVLSRLGRIGPLVFHLPKSANMMMREIGIVLFLACAGLKSGANFVSTLVDGDGVKWMLCGAMITLVPLLLAALTARIVMKMPFPSLCGLLAGSMTDPPALAFATTMNNSPAVSLSYATVYPLVMLMRVVVAQLIIVFFAR